MILVRVALVHQTNLEKKSARSASTNTSTGRVKKAEAEVVVELVVRVKIADTLPKEKLKK